MSLDSDVIIKLLTETQLSKEEGLRVIRAVKGTTQLETVEIVRDLNKPIENHELKPEDVKEGRKSGSFFGDPIVVLGR